MADDKPPEAENDNGIPSWVDMAKNGKIPPFLLDTLAQSIIWMALRKLSPKEKLRLVQQLVKKLWPHPADQDSPCDCACDACTSGCMHRKVSP